MTKPLPDTEDPDLALYGAMILGRQCMGVLVWAMFVHHSLARFEHEHRN